MYSLFTVWLLFMSVITSVALPQAESDYETFLSEDPESPVPSQDADSFNIAQLLSADENPSNVGLSEAQNGDGCQADADSFQVIERRIKPLWCPNQFRVVPDPETVDDAITSPRIKPNPAAPPITHDDSLEDRCSDPLLKKSTTPVCDSGRFGRDGRRPPGANCYTLFNIRLCMTNMFFNLIVHNGALKSHRFPFVALCCPGEGMVLPNHRS